MKILSKLIVIIGCITLLTACNKGNEIAGRSQSSVSKSARYIKERLPADKRLEFEVSFFAIRDSFKDGDAFLKEVDGKNPDQIIAIGKTIYEERKKAGVAEFAKYPTWEAMIANFSKERSSQGSKPSDSRDKATRSTIYKL
ncbi:MAG: hypothetical protein HOP02_14030 [Methylococcaceae bacterium]|nr:hypothetical protein [Methylococcaceae bacterium]